MSPLPVEAHVFRVVVSEKQHFPGGVDLQGLGYLRADLGVHEEGLVVAFGHHLVDKVKLLIQLGAYVEQDDSLFVLPLPELFQTVDGKHRAVGALVQPVVQVFEGFYGLSEALRLSSLEVQERGESLDFEPVHSVFTGVAIDFDKEGGGITVVFFIGRGEQVLGLAHEGLDLKGFAVVMLVEHHKYMVVISHELVKGRVIKL